MKLVGPEPRWETKTFPDGGIMIYAVCEAPDHSFLHSGEQCRCGVLDIGVVRDLIEPRRNDFTFFFEEFASITKTGCDVIVFTDDEEC